MDTSTNPGGVTQDPGGIEAPTQATPEQKDSVSYDSFKKLLDEKKAQDVALKAYKAKEQSDLEKAGEFKALYEAEKAAREAQEKQAREDKARFAYTSVASQFQAEAAKAGCKRPDALEKLVDLKEISSKVGSNYAVDKEALKAFVEKAAKEHDYLFAKEAPRFHDASPGNGKPPPEKGLKQMSLQEKIALLTKNK